MDTKRKHISQEDAEAYLRERSERAHLEKAREILQRAGKGNPPRFGDFLLEFPGPLDVERDTTSLKSIDL